ncbi:hypothetical protein BDP27DRAFT_1340768 [Rhodocollybia butyracea]|uniref:Uncharacterized protein n=1 Tax=Rhodocollybia butyracea TaxID=206335 RepID=A0A9P5TZ00_9AGAR|nr:hypothetical protein BDP27DRAFT_1340768 [Rhodocollybia butyracea]
MPNNNLIYSVFYFIEVRFYCCSLMSILNSRTALKEGRSNIVNVSTFQTTDLPSHGESELLEMNAPRIVGWMASNKSQGVDLELNEVEVIRSGSK